jgi:hypothetical protein
MPVVLLLKGTKPIFKHHLFDLRPHEKAPIPPHPLNHTLHRPRPKSN